MKEFTIISEYNFGTESFYVSSSVNISDSIKNAIANMSAEYMALEFTGYMDGHHFCITEVRNIDIHDDRIILSEQDIEDMYYYAHGPECITLRIN